MWLDETENPGVASSSGKTGYLPARPREKWSYTDFLARMLAAEMENKAEKRHAMLLC